MSNVFRINEPMTEVLPKKKRKLKSKLFVILLTVISLNNIFILGHYRHDTFIFQLFKIVYVIYIVE